MIGGGGGAEGEKGGGLKEGGRGKKGKFGRTLKVQVLQPTTYSYIDIA
jgi:hypothetical protein